MVLFGPVLDVIASLAVCNALSIGVTLFLKWFLHRWHSTGYPFAVTLTFMNMLVRWLVTAAMLKWRKTSPAAATLPRRDYWMLVIPIALSSALSVLFGNMAFYYITVTLSTVARSTQNVWTLLLSICLGHQRFSWSIVAVISLISLGVSLSAAHSTQFHLGGFLLMLLSAVLQTLQWVLTQSLLKRLDDTVSNPVLIDMSLTAPPSALCLLPMTIIFEGHTIVSSEIIRDPWLLLESSFWVVVGSALVCALVFSKVVLIHQTSALTLGISGSFRDVSQVLFAVLCFGDEISVTNGLGLTAVVIGVFLYSLLKHKKKHTAVKDLAQEKEVFEGIEIEPSDKDSLLQKHDGTSEA